MFCPKRCSSLACERDPLSSVRSKQSAQSATRDIFSEPFSVEDGTRSAIEARKRRRLEGARYLQRCCGRPRRPSEGPIRVRGRCWTFEKEGTRNGLNWISCAFVDGQNEAKIALMEMSITWKVPKCPEHRRNARNTGGIGALRWPGHGLL